MSQLRILQVFNRYLLLGGEEYSARRIHEFLVRDHEMIWFHLDSQEWVGARAPNVITQAARTIYNVESRRRFEHAVAEHQPDLALFHNIYPVGSPSLYHAAHRLNLPVVQYAHNYRPFSVSGALFARGRVITEPLRGHYWREVACGVWQNSIAKTAVLALAFKLLHRARWLDAVKAWICVSEFMCDKFVEAGVPADRVFGLRHSWEMMTDPPPVEDGGYYLFLSRLVEVKGVEVLLRAWQKIYAQLGAKAPELWMGGEGPLAGMLRDAATRNPRVRIVGLLKGEAKIQALRRCRGLMVPSVWWEPLGLVTCEAYDYSKPVLAAASGGLTETVRDGVTGLLHEPGNVDKIVSDVLFMEALTPERRAEMGRAGRQWLRDNAGIEMWREKINGILAEVMRRQAQAPAKI